MILRRSSYQKRTRLVTLKPSLKAVTMRPQITPSQVMLTSRGISAINVTVKKVFAFERIDLRVFIVWGLDYSWIVVVAGGSCREAPLDGEALPEQLRVELLVEVVA